MLASVKVKNFNISVVIPALNAEDYLPGLLEKIESQTLIPKEIVIVDSSLSKKTADIIEKWKGSIPIIYQRVDFAYPGHARNIGVELAKEEWIAFIDCRMIPDCDWLELSASTAEKSGAKFVGALRRSDADTHFKQILRAATIGCSAIRSLAGSIVLKKTFEESGGFISDVRAGEDLEWMHRLKSLGFKISWMTTPSLTYYGFVESLSKAVKKWHEYAFSNSVFEIRNNQKAIYMLSLLFATFFLVYNWNAIFAEWDETSIYFLPNVTKIFMLVVFAVYVVYRGIIRPHQLKVKLSFLLPWRWLKVSFVGLCLDLAKTPGLSWGAILLLYRRMRSIRDEFRIRKKPDV